MNVRNTFAWLTRRGIGRHHEFLPEIVEKVTQMVCNGYERWDCVVTITRVSVEFNTVGKDSPHVQLNGSSASVFSPADGTTNMAQIHGMVDNFGILGHQLEFKTGRTKRREQAVSFYT
jgi:hypothetical protein